MKPFEDSLIPQDWLKVARMDWDRIKRNLRDEDYIAAGFFLQQCLKKYLKAFLLSHGWTLRKIHRLDALLDDAVNHNSKLKDFYGLCERVSGYYLADRYPLFTPFELSSEDIENDLEEAAKFIKTIFPEEEV